MEGAEAHTTSSEEATETWVRGTHGARYVRCAVRTVRGTYGTAEAGTRTQYVQYAGPWGQVALRLRNVPNAGGWYA